MLLLIVEYACRVAVLLFGEQSISTEEDRASSRLKEFVENRFVLTFLPTAEPFYSGLQRNKECGLSKESIITGVE